MMTPLAGTHRSIRFPATTPIPDGTRSHAAGLDRPRSRIGHLLLASILGVSLLCLQPLTASPSAPSLSDADAKKVIQTRWKTSAIELKLGPLDAFGGFYGNTIKTDLSKGVLSEATYRWYQAFAKVGLISITDTMPQLPNAGVPEGQIAKILVRETAAGDQLARTSGLPQREGWLIISEGKFQIDTIIRNEPRQKGVDDYRVIMLTYSAQWTPEVKRAREIVVTLIKGAKAGVAEKRKAIVLLKYDPFKAAWIQIASDLADQDKDFDSKNVENALGVQAK